MISNKIINHPIHRIHKEQSQNNNAFIKHKNRIIQVPGNTNTTSPYIRKGCDQNDQRKQSQSLCNSPAKEDLHKQDEYLAPKVLLHTVSSSFSPQKQYKDDSSQKSLVPNQTIKNKGKKTLVLDLDETLIHSTFMKPPPRFDLNFKIYTGIVREEFFVSYRPGLFQFLKEMSEYYEIFIWTASLKHYADTIIDALDPQKNLISHRLYRENCNQIGNNFIKDLAMLNRDMKDLIIIDNLTACFKYHQENGIQIKDFIGNLQDNELEKYTPFLKFMSGLFDVRDVFKWQIKFENQSSFEYTNMQNENKIYIQNKLSKLNSKEFVPNFIIQKQSSTQQNQIIQLASQPTNNDPIKKEDYIYRSRRSISNVLDNHSKENGDINNVKNIEHSFGGYQKALNTENPQDLNKNVSSNPIFKEFTIQKLKIEESRLVEEQISKTSDRVLEKDNEEINKIDKNSNKLLETPQQNINKIIHTSYSNSITKQPNQYLQHHQLQPTILKQVDQIDHSFLIQSSSNRDTPSFEKGSENKENNKTHQNIQENQINTIPCFILEQSDKKCKQFSSDSSQKSQRLSDSSLNSTQPSTSVSATNINTSLCFQNTQPNETLRISFQNKQQFINLSKLSEEKVQLNNQENTYVSSFIQPKSEDKLSDEKELSEYNIYQSHPIPKFLQLPNKPIEKLETSQNQNQNAQKVYTFEPAKDQCLAQKQQQQIQKQINTILDQFINQTGRISLKQQNKEVPQIKKDPSIQTILMEQRPQSLDIQSQKKLNESDNSYSQQKFNPKTLDQQIEVSLNKNISRQIQNNPVMSGQLAIPNNQQQQNNSLQKNDNKMSICQKYNLSQQIQPQQQQNQQPQYYQFDNIQKQRSISTQSYEQQLYQKPYYMINKPEIPVKINNYNNLNNNEERKNSSSSYQVQQRINANQNLSGSQFSQQEQNNKQFSYYQYNKQNLNEAPLISNRILYSPYSPLKVQRNNYYDVNRVRPTYQPTNIIEYTNNSNISKISIPQQRVNSQTPSTASNSYKKELDNKLEKYSDNKIQSFEEYAIYGSKGQSVVKQRQYYSPYIQRNNYINNDPIVNYQKNFIKIN